MPAITGNADSSPPLTVSAVAASEPDGAATASIFREPLKAVPSEGKALVGDPMHKAFYKLVTSFLPKSLEAAIDAALRLLPPWAKHWGQGAASTLLTKSPLQLLFIDHVRSIQQV